MDEEYEAALRKDSGGGRLAIPPFVGAALGGVLGLMSAAGADNGGMLSGLVYPLHGGVGTIIGSFVGLGVGVFLYLTRPR